MSILCYLVHNETEQNFGSAFTFVLPFFLHPFYILSKTEVLLPDDINILKPGRNSDWKQ